MNVLSPGSAYDPTAFSRMAAVTNRQFIISEHGAADDAWLPPYLSQLRFIASLRPAMLVLREKDMDTADYLRLAKEVSTICRKAGVPFVVHNFPEALKAADADRIHLPFHLIRPGISEELKAAKGNGHPVLYGTSVHSVEDALYAAEHGASWLFAGNIYETDCKKGLAGRGLDFLQAVSSAVPIPVYGIGGITPELLPGLISAGAAGGCMMSGFMCMKPGQQ